jgi:hypothetical protein
MLQPCPQPRNQINCYDLSDEEQGDYTAPEPTEEEQFEDAQAHQLSPTRSERAPSQQGSPTASILVKPQPRFHLSLPYTSLAFRLHTAPRKTTADYDNGRVIRHLKMLTEDRHGFDPRSSPPTESS